MTTLFDAAIAQRLFGHTVLLAKVREPAGDVPAVRP